MERKIIIIYVDTRTKENEIGTFLVNKNFIKDIKKQFLSQFDKDIRKNINVIVMGGDCNHIDNFMEIEIPDNKD